MIVALHFLSFQNSFVLCGFLFYKTTITVFEGEPSPDLFIAIMRYLPVRNRTQTGSSSAPFGWSTNVPIFQSDPSNLCHPISIFFFAPFASFSPFAFTYLIFIFAPSRLLVLRSLGEVGCGILIF